MSGLRTASVHAGHAPFAGAAVTPLFQCSVFALEGEVAYHDIAYPRHGNTPTQAALARKLAALEGGELALVASSGMAAITTVLLHLLRRGGHLLVQEAAYGGTHSFVSRTLADFGMSHDFIDPDDPSSWEAKRTPETRAIYTEAISNPTMAVPDHAAVVDFARRHGLVAVTDATFATPVQFQPLKAGYDVVCHSMTKYLGGHSDLIAGCAVGPKAILEPASVLQHRLGGTLDVHTCYLVDRGLKTLTVRVRQQAESALALAGWLEQQPQVARVHYPGLPSSPWHGRARALFSGCGGMLAFELAGGLEAGRAFVDAVELALHAPSLGGPETLVTLPRTTSHQEMGAEDRRRLGITDGLVRVSVGLEDVEDVIADFGRALAGC